MAPEDWRARLRELAGRHGLVGERLDRLERLVSSLAGSEPAPTAITDPVRIVDAHVADSLAALEIPAVGAARQVVDIGSGAGFPGLPLAVALEGADVRLLESQRRKCAFLHRLVGGLQLERTEIVCERAEGWGEGMGAHDLALARAVGRQAVVLEYAAPLLAIGGTLVDWRGRRSGEEEERSRQAARELGMVREEVRRVEPFPGASEHHLHVFRKETATPPRYPRRAGIARKRPLGGS